MDKIFLVITVKTKTSSKAPSILSGTAALDSSLLDRTTFCSLSIKLIENISMEMGIVILKSACFEKDNRIALIIRADATNALVRIETFRKALELAGNKINVIIKVQKDDLFRYMHRI